MTSDSTKNKEILTILELRKRYPINFNNLPNKSEGDQIRVYKTIGKLAKKCWKTESLDQANLAKRSAAVDDLRLLIKEFQENNQKQKDSAALETMKSQASGKKKKKKKKPFFDLKGDLEVQLFGSTTSGFGFKSSDLDCCLVVRNPTTKEIFPTAIDAGFTSKKRHKGTRILLLLAEMMKTWMVPGRKWNKNEEKDLPIFKTIKPITNAKVPIIKCEHAPSGLPGDCR